MTEYQIVCITHDEKKRITHVRLTPDGMLFTIHSIITLMNNGDQFFTNENNQKVSVVHRIHPISGREYLTTKPDDVSENNLDFLPDCDPVSVPTTEDTNLGYTIPHLYVATRVELKTEIENNMKRFIFSSNGVLPIRHPGSFRIIARASYHITKLVDHRMQKATIRIPVSLKILSPDGIEFTAKRVTVDDLNRFRDFRGVSQGTWRYAASGDTGLIEPDDPENPEKVGPDPGYLQIGIDETVRSQSAGPLVDREVTSVGTKVYSFDLYRVGQFEARVSSDSIGWIGTLQLKDPNGTVVASSSSSGLRFPVTQRTLDQSRDAAGQTRRWTLEVRTTKPGSGSKIRATVITTLEIPVKVIQDRIDWLIGENGNKISIYGENYQGRAIGRFVILDRYTAETVQMWKLLNKVLEGVEQDPAVQENPGDIQAGVEYNFLNIDNNITNFLSVDISSFKVDALKITIGASKHIKPVVPAVGVRLDIQGGIDLYTEGNLLGTIELNDNNISLEIGVKINDSGEVMTVSWIKDDPLDIDISTGAWIDYGTPTGFVGLLAFKAWLRHTVNDAIINKFRSIFEGAILDFPRIMLIMLGSNFTLTSLRMAESQGDTIVIDYVSPVEPEPKPNESYTGVIGRSIEKDPVQPGWKISPPTLGDTWAAGNLRTKIQHIVVVMMENRSFDHVLGYRAQLPNAQNEDGLTEELIKFLDEHEPPFNIDALNTVERIFKNRVGLRTKFPAHVGHHFTDVTQQLDPKHQLQTESGLMINGPQGFVDNFEPKIGSTGLIKNDVLGYYTGEDLEMYEFLAENYAYCQRYFCSHPGPTIPNRMYWLTGDVQYDRTGEAIIENPNSDNLQLSRALNIFDVLERKNISWRVYESFPSVVMLRMFARYAVDNTNIVDIKSLEADIAVSNLPSVTFIEPAMHHEPQNDDHPIADMFHGQHFIKRVYDALCSNKTIWRNTLLIVTYDEHGGFYDHVIPLIADAFTQRASPTDEPTLDTSFKNDMTIPYGVRVPTFVVSPWVPPGKGPDIVLDHCSIIKTILARFCGESRPFLSDRVDASHSFESFLTLSEPRLDEVPSSPSIPSMFSPGRRSNRTRAIITKPVTKKELDEGTPDFHEITGMLARMLGRI